MGQLSYQQRLIGARVSPNVRLASLAADDCDDKAAYFDARLVLRVDPRDIRRTVSNPTGIRVAHPTAPNRDPAYFTKAGLTIEALAAYAGEEVFVFGTADAHNLKIPASGLTGVTEFTAFGVSHYASAMLGTAGFHTLFAMYRDGNALESVIAHQYVSGVNYLSIYSDQGTVGAGLNHVLDGSTAILPDVPFAWAFRVTGTSVGNSVMQLYVNTMVTPLISATGRDVPEGGAMEVYLGHLTASNQLWQGAMGKVYVVLGSTLGNADDQAASAALMASMKAKYGVA